MEHVNILSSMHVLVVMCATSVLTEIRQNYFHMDNRYDNILPNGGMMWNFNVSKLLACGQECFHQAGCVSVFFRDGHCMGWNTRLDDLSPTTRTDNMRYYEMRGLYGNVAEGKPVVQSSTQSSFVGSYVAANAVTGSRYPVATQPNISCSCTNKNNLEWWQVDLLNTFLVTDVAVLKRIDDTGGMSLVNVRIEVAEDPAGPFTQCYNTGPTNCVTRFETFTCDTPINGRYVKLSKLVQMDLCLCEVEDYAGINLIVVENTGWGNSVL